MSLLQDEPQPEVEWATPVFGTEDMSSAYRQLLDLPQEAAGLVLASWNPDEAQVRYAVLRAHPVWARECCAEFQQDSLFRLSFPEACYGSMRDALLR